MKSTPFVRLCVFATSCCSALFICGVLLADDPPAPQAKKDDAKPAKSDSATPPGIGDLDLLKSLNKRLNQEPDAPPLEQIGSKMRDVQGRLAKSDSGDETQGVQRQIVEDIDKLIEAAKKAAEQQKKQQQQQQQKKKKDGSQQQQQPGDPNEKADNSDPKNRQVTPKVGKLSDAQLESSERLVRAVWGHLPEKLREEMQQSAKEGDLPKYRSLIEQYFKAIAEQSAAKK